MQRLSGPAAKDAEQLPGARQAKARIAQRFAPRAPSAVAPGDLQADAYAPLLRALTGSFVWPRTLIASLVLLALLPNLTVAAFLWLPGLRSYWSQPVTAVKLADAGSAPVRADKPKPAPEIHPVLTIPQMVEAKAGDDISFPLALDGTDGVPPRSSIAISGLPAGALLSNGRPYGATGWNLKADEIGDLHLVLGDAAAGETRVQIELLAPDGKVLAGAETLLKVAMVPEALPKPAPASEPQGARAELQARAEPEEVAAPEKTSKPDTEVVADAPSGDAVQSAPTAPQPTAPAAIVAEESEADWIKPSAFVNLREGPSSSSAVIGVISKGTKLKVTGRKRRWVQVTNPTTAESGWIYGRYVDGAAGSGRSAKRARAKDTSDSGDSMWSRLGRWFTGS